jgi:prepilin-type processing-associated H-X9-DG protein
VVMFLEESPMSINDGVCVLDTIGAMGQTLPSAGVDYLSVRHDRLAKSPDTFGTGGAGVTLTGKDAQVGFFNAAGRGNVAFVDGHVDYVTREFVHAPLLHHWDPLW